MPSDGITCLKFLLPRITYDILWARPGYLKNARLAYIFESRALADFHGESNGITYSEIAGPQRFCEYAIFFG